MKSRILKNTKISQRDKFKISMMGTESFPPCGDMPYLMDKLKTAGLKVVGTVLDAGCGQARFMRYLSQLLSVTEVIGVDVSDECIKLAMDRAPGRSQDKFTFFDMDIVRFLKRNKKKFDVVSAFNLLEYAEDPEDVMKRLVSSVRTKGYLVGSVYLGEILPGMRHSWETVEDFEKQFPNVEIVNMHKPEMNCIVFIYHKVKGRAV